MEILHCVKSVRGKKSDKFYGVAEQFSAELKGAEKMQCVNIKFADFFCCAAFALRKTQFSAKTFVSVHHFSLSPAQAVHSVTF